MAELRDTWTTIADHPEAVAIRAIGFLKSRRSERTRFLAGTGLTETDLGRRPVQPEHLAAIFDYLIANEAALLDFARATDLPPEAAYEARRLFARCARSGGSA
jgi:hypothetical protein